MMLYTGMDVLNVYLDGKSNSIYYLISYNLDNIDICLLMSGAVPIKIYKNLTITMNTESFKYELYRMGGVYGFINVSNDNNLKQYIGSSKDVYQRFLDHYKGRDTNIRLKRSIAKYGGCGASALPQEKFNFVIYY
jgi:hypothetical protein